MLDKKSMPKTIKKQSQVTKLFAIVKTSKI